MNHAAERGLRRVEILGLPLLTGTPQTMATWLVEEARRPHDTCTIVSHINANNYYWLQRDVAMRTKIRSGCVLVLDGIGIQLGAYLLGAGWLPNLNGTDLFPLVMRQAARAGLRVFLLGSRPDVAARSAEIVRRRFPGVEIAGWHSGHFAPGDELDIVREIRARRPHILLVGRGFLRQEEFSLRHRTALGVPLIWNVGGLFDFVSGARARAPELIRRARLEWAFRFLLDPRAMWHRNLIAAPWFVAHLLAHVGRRASGSLAVTARAPEGERTQSPRAIAEQSAVHAPAMVGPPSAASEPPITHSLDGERSHA